MEDFITPKANWRSAAGPQPNPAAPRGEAFDCSGLSALFLVNPVHFQQPRPTVNLPGPVTG